MRYKGRDILLKALDKLPLKFNLLIAGGFRNNELEQE